MNKKNLVLKTPLDEVLSFDENCSFQWDVALENAMDGNPDWTIKSHLRELFFDTFCEFPSLKTDFEGLRFYNINKGNTDGILNQIVNNQLGLSKIDFNDALDPLISLYPKLVRHGKSRAEKRVLRLFENVIKENLRIACLCGESEKSINNQLMWAHYANSHKGICVNYSLPTESIVFLDKKHTSFCVFNQVKYTKKKKKIENLTLEDALFLKTFQWNYENEFRLISFSEKNNQEKYPTVGNVKINAVYLGCKIQDKIIGQFRNRLEPFNIPLYKMVVKTDNLTELYPLLLQS